MFLVVGPFWARDRGPIFGLRGVFGVDWRSIHEPSFMGVS
jgi:hypothetical protein